MQNYNKSIVCNEDDKNENNLVRAAELLVISVCSWGLMLKYINQHYPFRFLGRYDSEELYEKVRELTDNKSY